MKMNKKVQKMNSVQKSEKETAVKVTALAIIHDCRNNGSTRNGNRSHRSGRSTAANHA